MTVPKRPLVPPDNRVEALTKEIKLYTDQYSTEIDRIQREAETSVSRNANERDKVVVERQQKISGLQAIREPQIGPGEMPFLIIVEWFSEGGIRTHGHLCGRTVRDNDSQVWNLFNAQTEAQSGLIDWNTMVENYILKTNQSVRLHMPAGYEELGRHSSLDATVQTFPEFGGKTVQQPTVLSTVADGKFASRNTESRRQTAPGLTIEQRASLRVVVTARLVAGDVIRLNPNPDYGQLNDRYGNYGRIPNTRTVEFEAQRDENYGNYNRR